MTFTSSVAAHMASGMTPSGDDGNSAAVLMRMSTPPKAATVASRALANGFAAANVDGAGGGELRGGDAGELGFDSVRAFEVEVGDHDMGSARRSQASYFAADAAASADHQGHAAAEFFLRRLAADLGFFQGPVFDAEGLTARAGQRSW